MGRTTGGHWAWVFLAFGEYGWWSAAATSVYFVRNVEYTAPLVSPVRRTTSLIQSAAYPASSGTPKRDRGQPVAS